MDNIKKCTCCKLDFPKTKDYFFVRIIKQQNKNGIGIYHLFRAICKSCNNKKTEQNRIKKRCKEMNCNISDYKENWKKQYSETRTKYKIDVTISKYHSKHLTDTYIKQLYRCIDVPKEMIETKRLIIKLKRELKNGK
jgi:hypothetical protein